MKAVFYLLGVVVTSRELGGLRAPDDRARASDASKMAHIVKYTIPCLAD